jgi:hypothetical protein
MTFIVLSNKELRYIRLRHFGVAESDIVSHHIQTPTLRGEGQYNKHAHGRRHQPGSYAIVAVAFPMQYLINSVCETWDTYILCLLR